MARRLVGILVMVLALVGVVSADGGINGAANGYLGGDSFFCSSTRGCWLLNSNSPANGSVPALLGEFAQADIQAALATCAAESHNVTIGTIQGTYGPFTLSAVYDGPNADPVCSLQINASEGVGKEAKPYVFKPTPNGGYDPIASSTELVRCQWDLAAGGWWSFDGVHNSEGFDVMNYSKPNEWEDSTWFFWVGSKMFFLEWVPDNPGFLPCPVPAGV
jgi:hypothetical protein